MPKKVGGNPKTSKNVRQGAYCNPWFGGVLGAGASWCLEGDEGGMGDAARNWSRPALKGGGGL